MLSFNYSLTLTTMVASTKLDMAFTTNTIEYSCSSGDYRDTEFVGQWLRGLAKQDLEPLEIKIQRIMTTNITGLIGSGNGFVDGIFASCPSKICQVFFSNGFYLSSCASAQPQNPLISPETQEQMN